jgi:hypothetical protein
MLLKKQKNILPAMLIMDCTEGAVVEAGSLVWRRVQGSRKETMETCIKVEVKRVASG